jgi:hypothetical protein
VLLFASAAIAAASGWSIEHTRTGRAPRTPGGWAVVRLDASRDQQIGCPHLGFLGAAAFVELGIIAAATIGTRATRRQATLAAQATRDHPTPPDRHGCNRRPSFDP